MDVERSTDDASSSARNTISTLSLCPRRMVSPCSERPLGDLLAVDERAVARGAVAQQIASAVVADDLGVLARDVGADELQIGGRAPPDEEHGAVEPDDAAALAVSNLEASFGHGRALDFVTGPPARSPSRC